MNKGGVGTKRKGSGTVHRSCADKSCVDDAVAISTKDEVVTYEIRQSLKSIVVTVA